MSIKRLTLNVKQPLHQAQQWVSRGDASDADGVMSKARLYTARLTLDITMDLRRRIKTQALARGITVAQLLRELLEREFQSPEEGRR